MLNPLLHENWKEVKPWLEENFELFAEPHPGALYEYLSLDMVRDVGKALRPTFAERWDEQNGNLEMLVIEKIDAERELKRMNLLLSAHVI
jgi:hypothetical protein